MYQWYPSTRVGLLPHMSCCDPSPYNAISHTSRLLLWEEEYHGGLVQELEHSPENTRTEAPKKI